MTDSVSMDAELSARLAELRAALRNVPVPTATERSLREAFRGHRANSVMSAATASPEDRPVRQWLSLALAAALGAIAFSPLWMAAPGRLSPVSEPLANASRAAEATLTFEPLESFAAAPSGALSLVRVRIPLSSLTIIPGSEAQGSIEAELLVGEDGIARAIRFPAADVATRSAAAN